MILQNEFPRPVRKRRCEYHPAVPVIPYNIRTSPVSFLAILELRMKREINRHGKVNSQSVS